MKKLRLALAVLLLLSTVATVQAVTGKSVYSWLLEGSANTLKTCADLDDVYADPGTTWVEYKFDANPSDGAGGCQAGGGDGTIAVTFSNCTSGGFDWSSTIGVDAVVVKDGVDGANFYVYDGLSSPADGTVGTLPVGPVSPGVWRDSEEMSDTNLTTPNDGAKGTSHVSFCYDVEEDVPSIAIEKSTNGEDADNPTGPVIPVGDPVAWTYHVQNTGNVALTNVTVTDDQGVAVSCPKTTLAVGESMTCTANGTAAAGQYANLGTATGEYNGTTVSDEDPSHYFGEKPTAIAMPGSSFNAEASAGRVTLTWETGTEIDNAGFNLYRAMLKDGPYTQINEALIAAEGEAVSGASYSFVDALDYGTYYYKLEDVDLYGMSTLHGPVKVTVARPLRRPLYRPALPEF